MKTYIVCVNGELLNNEEGVNHEKAKQIQDDLREGLEQAASQADDGHAPQDEGWHDDEG